jgi:HK97 family phage portal protein
MKIFGFDIRREARAVAPETRAASAETETVPVSAESFLAFFGQQSVSLPAVTIDSALMVPAVWAAVAFLSRTLAALPLHAYRKIKDGPERITGKLETVVHEAPSPGQTSFAFRQWFWQQVFTGGRGLAWIERTPQGVEAIWPMDPGNATIKRSGFQVTYEFDGRTYPAADVIDVAFMPKRDGLGHYGPIAMAGKAIQLALAMNDYASTFFAGGGIPPLALTGPLPQGAEAMKRAMADIHRAIDAAKKSDKPIFPMPPGHDLKQVGFDPEKGQMTDARRLQVEEIARVYQLPPVFLQDLSRATFTNAEVQDLHLVKHLVGQWAQALEQEMNLKLFGRLNGARFVEHNLDGLMRGDFKSRIEGIARGIQSGLLTPNEGRALENRPKHSNPAADELFVQGATVVLGAQPADNGGGDEPGTSGVSDAT